MIIKSIELTNFRQFKGTNKIEFSTDSNKNVTVFIGNITAGKTTILNAFKWCLYGETNFDSKELLNLDILSQLTPFDDAYVKVELVLSHEGKEYTITRTQKYMRNNGNAKACGTSTLKVIYKDAFGATQDDAYDYDKIIDSILPKDLSEYFFVEGEKIKNINKKANLKESVKNIMGLNVIQAGRDHFDAKSSNSVISKLNKEFDTGNEQKTYNLINSLDDIKSKLLKEEKNKEVINTQIDYFENEKNRYNNKLLENQEVESMQQDTIRLENDIKNYKMSVDTLEKRLNGVFKAGTYKFFASPLIDKVLHIIENTNVTGEGIPDMKASSIDFIINRGYCICGCELTKNEGAKERLRMEQKMLPPESLGTTLRNYKKKCKDCLNSYEDLAERIKDDYKMWRSHLREISIKQEQIDDISKKMIGKANVQEIRAKYDDAVRNLQRQYQLKGACESNIERLKKDLEDTQRELDSMRISSDKNKKLSKYLAYANAIFNWFNDSYVKHEKEVQKELLESVNKIFTKMYVSGQRKVEMDNEYRISLKYNDGRPDTSTGLETIKNFSFIGGLIDLARTKAKSKVSDSNVELSTEPYPLVMDAPFSPLDSEHIESASKLLPELAEQLIIFVKDNDWDLAKNILNNKVGLKYTIEKQDEIHSLVRRMENV